MAPTEIQAVRAALEKLKPKELEALNAELAEVDPQFGNIRTRLRKKAAVLEQMAGLLGITTEPERVREVLRKREIIGGAPPEGSPRTGDAPGSPEEGDGAGGDGEQDAQAPPPPKKPRTERERLLAALGISGEDEILAETERAIVTKSGRKHLKKKDEKGKLLVQPHGSGGFVEV